MEVAITKMENNASKLWNSVLKLIKSSVNEVDFNSWLKNVEPYNFDGSKLFVNVESLYIKNKIEEKYKSKIEETLNIILFNDDEVHQLEVITKEPKIYEPGFTEKELHDNIKYNEIKPKPMTLFQDGYNNLNVRYIFENFIVGKSNELAHAAAQAIANKTEVSKYNPLFIYGGVGLGKTHLMHAIGNRLLEEDSSKKILYCTSEQFTNDLINSINKGKMVEFRAKYRKLDLLLIDDIQFIAGKDSTQEEFFHTFNELYQDGKQIVLSSDRPPKEIDHVEKRLVSRFEWGLPVDIQQPDYETRVAILRKKAEIEEIAVSEKVLRHIAEAINSNIRELEGALNKIVARASLLRKDISISLVEEVFYDEIKTRAKVVNEDKIITVVSEFYGIPIDSMKSKKRKKDIARARQVAMYFLRNILDKPFKEIGEIFGGKDHSTVMHSVGKVEEDMKGNKYFEKDMGTIKEKIIS